MSVTDTRKETILAETSLAIRNLIWYDVGRDAVMPVSRLMSNFVDFLKLFQTSGLRLDAFFSNG